MKINKLTIFLISILCILFFGAQISNTILSPIVTVKAVPITANDSIHATGYFIRNEVIVDMGSGGNIEYPFNDGEKTAKGCDIGIVYPNSTAFETRSQIKFIQDRIQVIDNAVSSTGDLSSSSKLDDMIHSEIINISNLIQGENFKDFNKSVNELRTVALRRGFAFEDSELAKAEEAKLEAELSSLSGNTLRNIDRVKSPTSGYFYSYVDGYENYLNVDNIDSYDVSYIANVKKEDDIYTSHIQKAKIIKDFEWYFAAIVPSNISEKVSVGKSVKINLKHTSEPAPAVVYAIKPDSDGNTLLILKGDVVNNDILNIRRQPVEIILSTHKGLKVPKDALRVLDGVHGVYTLNGNITRFKKVEILYDLGSAYIVDDNSTKASMIVQDDEIVIKAKDIQNNKIIN